MSGFIANKRFVREGNQSNILFGIVVIWLLANSRSWRLESPVKTGMLVIVLSFKTRVLRRESPSNVPGKMFVRWLLSR